MEPAYKLNYHDKIEPQKKKAVKTQSKRIWQPSAAAICIIAIVFVGCAVLYIGQQVTTMQLSVQLNQMKNHLDRLKQEQGQLVIELEQASRLSTIEAIARYELNMVDPVNAEMIVLDLENEIESGGEGWVIAEDKEENIFTIVAQWINQWLPVGGVEAGRIGN